MNAKFIPAFPPVQLVKAKWSAQQVHRGETLTLTAEFDKVWKTTHFESFSEPSPLTEALEVSSTW
jgi:hypothetical protein